MKKKSKKDKPVEQTVVYRKFTRDIPTAIIVDIDGTIALINGRSPFDPTKFHEDLPHIPIINMISLILNGAAKSQYEVPTVLFMTGREDGTENRQATMDWLKKYTHFFNYPGTQLYMRAEGDQRGDVIVKREMYEKHVDGKYNVLWVFEDRNKMVNFWRNEMKIPTLQVKDGDY